MTPLLISLAGGLGAVSRFIADGLLRTVVGRVFPWSTIIINVSGSLLLGVILGVALHHSGTDTKLIWGTGFCGGYTTFSTASYEAVRLIEERRIKDTIIHIGSNLVLTIIFFSLGMLVVQ
ncbi:hypothetical protein B7Y94_05270 [Candidatus Saccharibacteria bacterium 32-49-12]|nr:MAG: hypothetical protein B7Y94_05270 [Candidatus Saccharibacteria bacterium 32-49-12]